MKKIRHCLFWFENNRITAVMFYDGEKKPILIGGKSSVEYTNVYWNEWKEHSGCCLDDMIDFCIIYDKEIAVPHELQKRCCKNSESVWNTVLISRIVDEIVSGQVTEYYSKDGKFIFQTGISNKADSIRKMGISFMNIEKEIEVIEESKDKTPLILYYEKEKKEYDKYKECREC